METDRSQYLNRLLAIVAYHMMPSQIVCFTGIFNAPATWWENSHKKDTLGWILNRICVFSSI